MPAVYIKTYGCQMNERAIKSAEAIAAAEENRALGLTNTCRTSHLISMSTATAQIDIGALITRTPGIKGGTPHLAGTGVTVRTIVRWHRSGLEPEQIAVRIGHISLGQVHAALAFYYANKEMMDDEMAEEEAESARLKREYLTRRDYQGF